MEWYWAALLLFGLGVGLMMLGIPVAIAFFATNIVAAALFMGGGPGIMQVINNGFGAMTSFALVPIPMFLLMGELFYHTGLAHQQRSEEHTSELQSRPHLVCRLLLEKKKHG